MLRSKLRQADPGEETAFVPQACITARKTLKTCDTAACPFFWYSLLGSILLPRQLGYKEYLRISSDILLPRKLGYKEYLRISSDILLTRKLGNKKYFKIFSDILYVRACEVGGKKLHHHPPGGRCGAVVILLYPFSGIASIVLSSYLASSDIKNI